MGNGEGESMKLRWLVAVLAIIGGFFISGIVGSLVTDALGFWSLPGAGFSAAVAVVVVTYMAAPHSKFVAACIALLVGAIVAWLTVEPYFFPESYQDGRAYQPTHLPIAATYIGGILGLLAVAIYNFTRKPNNSLKSDVAKPRALG